MILQPIQNWKLQLEVATHCDAMIFPRALVKNQPSDPGGDWSSSREFCLKNHDHPLDLHTHPSHENSKHRKLKKKKLRKQPTISPPSPPKKKNTHTHTFLPNKKKTQKNTCFSPTPGEKKFHGSPRCLVDFRRDLDWPGLFWIPGLVSRNTKKIPGDRWV